VQQIINKYGIDGVWHFTDGANLASINQHGGLLCYAELRRRGIAIPAAGGNDWSHEADAWAGVDEYVHLAFIPNHPMLYLAKKDGRIKQAYWLKIDRSVLFVEGIHFTREVANKSGIRLLTVEEAKDEIDWEVLFTRTDWSDPAIKARRQAAEKSQILIPKTVPLEKIIGKMNG
jgi:hypothetical protein